MCGLPGRLAGKSPKCRCEKENAAPLFDWGKYFDRDGKKILPFSAHVHHSFVDGIHIGRLADSLQNALNEE